MDYNTSDEKFSYPSSYYNIAFSSIILSLLAVLFWQANRLNTSFLKTIELFIDKIYKPDANLFILVKIGDFNLTQLFYGIIFISLVLALILKFAFLSQQKKITFSFIIHGNFIVLTLCIIFAGLQLKGQMDFFIKNYTTFNNKTVEEKNHFIFKEPYRFTQLAGQQLNTSHNVKTISDANLTQDPFMINYFSMAYHLFPKALLRYKNESPEDILLIFFKKNLDNSIPSDHRILAKSAKDYIIMTITKEATP